MITALYVLSVVAANLFVTAFGPSASILSAFVCIGATMTLRDRLHEEWRGRGLVWKMGTAIGAAGLLSAAINASASKIALASMVAFIASETVDALVYQALGSKPWLVRANGSNVPAALVDSILFPLLAFGGVLPWIMLGQFCAKVFGGAIWSFILRRGVVSLLLVLAAAGSAQAQTIALNGAWIHNPYVSAAAGEVFIGAPPVIGLRPYTIVSWNTSAGAEPTVLVRVGHTHRFGSWMVGAGAGVIRLPGDQFRPSLSGIVFGPGRGRVRPYALAAYEKTPSWTRTTFVGLTYTVYFRR